MAKSSRSSRVKKNNSVLKKKVFGPVETARMQRQNAKLLALTQQPKPPRPEMEIVQEDGKSTRHTRCQSAYHVAHMLTCDADAAAKDSEKSAEGTPSPSLSIAIPKSLLSPNTICHLPSPPCTPPTDNDLDEPILDLAGQKAMAQEQLFYHLLGASSDILGFDVGGDLRLAFSSRSTSEG